MPTDRRGIEIHIREVEESLATRIAELGHRVERVRHALDLREQVSSHPWPAMGIAVGVGLLLGRRSVAATSLTQEGGTRPSIGGGIAREVWRSLLTALVREVAEEWREQRRSSATDVDVHGTRLALTNELGSGELGSGEPGSGEPGSAATPMGG